MTTRGWGYCAFLLLASSTAIAAEGTWKNFTSMKDVKGLAMGGTSLWAATSGGLFRWVEGSENYLQLTNAEGLSTIDLTSVGIDRNGDVWSGSSTGVIHIYTPSTASLRTVTDIASVPGQTDKQINAFTATGDTILISTDFGLSLFRLTRNEFGDTFSKFGTIPSNVKVAVYSAVISGGRIWAAISDGIATHCVASASLTSPNLLEPLAWTLHTPGGVPRALAVHAGRVYAGTTTGLFSYDGAIWQSIPSLSGKSIIALSPSASSLAICTVTGEVWTVDASNNAQIYGTTLPFVTTSIATGSDGKPIVGTISGGISTFSASSWTSHSPNGPNSNQFTSVAIGPDGFVWGASGEGAGRGFYRRTALGWNSYTMQNSPLPANEVYRVSIGCNGSLWASIYGRGIVEIPGGTDVLDSAHVYGRNVGMVGIPGDQNFVVTSAVACDGQGNLWTSIVLAADRNVLAVRKPNGTWQTVPVILNGTKLTDLMDRPVDLCLAVDGSDNLWATVRDAGFKGVIAMANHGRIDSVAAFHVTSANGLPSDEVKTIVVDKDNDIWVGTDRGIAIILDPSNPTRSGGIAAYKPLNGLVINCIAVDPLNQKWVGTSEGVVLLSSDGTQQLLSYTLENTQGKLIDNDVKSIAIDAETGTVYFGTAYGLASLTTAAAAPRKEFDRLSVYPNPYRVPNPIAVTIDGLIANSSMKILRLDGTLVRDIKTPGGRVGFWDGRDEKGNVVGSGVYIVVGYSEDGSQTGNGKVAVIRR